MKTRKVILFVLTSVVLPLGILLAFEGLLRLIRFPLFENTLTGKDVSNFQSWRYRSADLEETCEASKVITNKKKIFVLGESVVEGSGVKPSEKFTNLLQQNLNARYPNQYEVLSFAKIAKDSTFAKECLARLIDLRPHLVILYSGHNDYVNYFHPNALPALFRENRPLLRMLYFFRENSRLFSALNVTLMSPSKREVYPFKTIDEYQKRHEFVVDHFLQNVEEMRQRLKSIGSKLVVVTPVSNLSDFKTVDRPYEERLFIELRNRSWDLVKLGKYKLARDWDPVPTRATEAFNQRLRDFAARGGDLVLVDFEKALEAEFGQAIGCNLFGNGKYCDQFHLNALAHRRLASLLTESVF